MSEKSTPSSKDENQSNGNSPAPETPETESNPPDSANGKSTTPPVSTASAGKAQNSTTSNKTYIQLIHEAITALKDRTGSSMPAIKKWLLQQYSHLEDTKHFRQHINQGIKSGVSQGRFEKIRNSFKISASWKEKERSKKRKSLQAAKAAKAAKEKKAMEAKTAAALKAKQAEKQKSVIEEQKTPKTYKELVKFNKEKRRKLRDTVGPLEFQKMHAQMQKKEQALFKKEDAERRERERQERIKKRRFPMEDTRLHEEDKELGVKPPPDVVSRPVLPYFWQMTLPFGSPGRQGRTPDQLLRNSKSDALFQGSRGLVSDLLQVYHFFRGDVHFTGDITFMQQNTASKAEQKASSKRKKSGGDEAVKSSLVPDFSLSNLVYATEEIINGNARRSRLLPPLISHLFVTSLQLLCRPPDDAASESTGPEKDPQKHLQFELNKYLLPALTPGSWPDICHLYMDAVERFYSTDSSRDPGVLPPLNTDLSYLFMKIDEPAIPMTPAPVKKTPSSADGDDKRDYPLPDGYGAYLGDYRSVLYRAHEKLGRSEAWALTAEEIFTLLRALTDDLLAFYPGIAEQVALREEKMFDLLKTKKAADAKLRKVRLAFEGPKKPKRTQDASNTTDTKDDKEESANGDSGEFNGAFKPTATKKEYEAAIRAQQKANDAYEKGIRQLVARTEPVGYDRNFNAVFCFRHDPEILYVEEMRAPSYPLDLSIPEGFQFNRRSWHVIETTSLFDAFTSSLDIRGKREQDLYEEMLGPPGSQQSLRRFLYDDKKVKSEESSRRREKEALYERLEAAKNKCDEEKGRRSGRLADQSEEELAKVQKEIDEFEKKSASQETVQPVAKDRTGLDILQLFDSGQGRRETRRSRGKKEQHDGPVFQLLCSNLIPSGNIDGTGVIGMLVSQLFSVEEACQDVSLWEPDEKRQLWIRKLENAVHSWYIMSIQNSFERSEAIQSSPNGSLISGSGSKKRRGSDGPIVASGGSQSMSSIINSLKQPLLEIENRVADITNIAVSSRDAEIADDNMSTDGSGDVDQHKLDTAWKKELHRLRSTSARQHVKVRERLVNAISLARKAHASDVVTELRAALLLYHPNAASDSRKAGITILESHGDFSGPDIDEDMAEDETEEDKGETEEATSVLSAEAALLIGCLGGSEEATRNDWIELVKSSKTLSRLSALTAGFRDVALRKLEKIKMERDDLLSAISIWQKEAKKTRAGKKNAKSSEIHSGPSEVWADVTFSKEICMAKAEEWPWWPAKICKAKNPKLQKTIDDLERVFISLMGEMGGIRIVKKEMIRPFTGEPVSEDLTLELPKKTKLQLDECLAMTRRVQRGISKSK